MDVRLGCLGGSLVPDSEPQKIIDAAKFALRNVAALELKAPFWRYIPTPLWTRYVRNMNYFIEYVNLILISCYFSFFDPLSMCFPFFYDNLNFRVCMKYIDAATERLKKKKSTNEEDHSLIERILATETNPKVAYILALDLILVGIDTVCEKENKKII